jgi:hypothetical protein
MGEQRTASGGGRGAARMLFLGGIGSGGTDLMWNILNAHQEVFLVGELPFLPALADRYPPSIPAERLGDLVRELRRLDEYNTLAHHHWENFLSDRKDEIPLGPPPEPVGGRVTIAQAYEWLIGVPRHVRVTGNKTPTNAENIGRLARLFPGAHFVLVARDPRDVALSWRARWDRDELLTADKWERRLAAGRAQLAELEDGHGLLIRYEDVLEDLEACARRLCEFLGLDFDARMLEFDKHVTKTISGQENRGRPLIADNHGKWRAQMPFDVVRRIEEITWHGLIAFGYAPSLAEGPVPLTRFERLRGRARDVGSVLLGRNAHQTRGARGRRWARRIVLQVKRLVRHRRITT